MTSLHRCPKRGTAHSAHPIRLYFSGMGAVVPTTCPGEYGPEPRPESVAEDRDFYDSLYESIPSDVPDTVWESDGLSKGAEA